MKEVPFFDLLPASDATAAHDLRRTIFPKYHRGNRLEHFSESIAMVVSFVDKEAQDSWKRALLCGVCQMDTTLAVNNARLQVFSGRSKSSINDLFAKMGYRTVPVNQNNQLALLAKIPYLNSDNNELRQWTYRVPGRAGEIIIPACTVPCELPVNANHCIAKSVETEPGMDFESGFCEGGWADFWTDGAQLN
jgi:hypothetical protein